MKQRELRCEKDGDAEKSREHRSAVACACFTKHHQHSHKHSVCCLLSLALVLLKFPTRFNFVELNCSVFDVLSFALHSSDTYSKDSPAPRGGAPLLRNQSSRSKNTGARDGLLASPSPSSRPRFHGSYLVGSERHQVVAHSPSSRAMALLVPFTYTVNIIVCFALLVESKEEQVFA